jgi:DnaA family protein
VYKQLPLAISPDINATFDNYYISESNQAVITALQQFVMPAGSCEPFIYLCGSQGSGVTHLLEATQNYSQSQSQSKPQPLSIQYLPLEELKNYPPADILEGMEQLDMVCIDDLQVICGHEQWEQQLFHLFNRLRDTGKQLLVGSHLSPRQLPLQLADLQSRLQWGAVFQLQPLQDQEKAQLLILRAHKLGLELPQEVANYLLQRMGRSSSELIALLKHLDLASLSEQRKLTIPFVKTVLDM